MGGLSKAFNGFRWLRDPYAYLDRELARGRMTFRLELPGPGMEDALVTGEVPLIEEIQRNPALVGGRGTRFLRPAVGETALIVLDGPRHEERRRALVKHFFLFQDPRVEASTSKRLSEALAAVQPGEVFSVLEFLDQTNLKIILDLVFGEMSKEDHAELYGLMRHWIHAFGHPILLFAKAAQRFDAPFTPWGRFLARRADVLGWIDARVRSVEGQSEFDAEKSLLDRLLEERKQGRLDITREELVWQLIEIILFGHDTSAGALSWFFQHLLGNPEALERVKQGLIPGSRLPKGNGDFLKAALFESLRLTPVVVHLTREAVEDTVVGGHSIRKGARALPCAYLAHRNPKIFSEPQRFDPSRFLEGFERYRSAYFPFGFGQRLCVGMPVALRQMYVLATGLLARGELKLEDSRPAGPARKAVLVVPAGGTRVSYTVLR